MATLLIVTHSPTAATRRLREASVSLVSDPDIFGPQAIGAELTVLDVDALEATSPQLFLAADAYLFGSPVNFGYISGALKHSFDCVYNDLLEAVAGRPFSYWLHGRYDATGAQRAMDAITTGLDLTLAAEPIVRLGEVSDADCEAVAELGGTLGALITG